MQTTPRHFGEEFFSWVVPCETARTQVSEYVGHIGVQMIKTIVIAGQSQDRAAKVGLSRKIGDVKKTLQELRMLSGVTLKYQETKIVMFSVVRILVSVSNVSLLLSPVCCASEIQTGSSGRTISQTPKQNFCYSLFAKRGRK